MVGMIPLGEIEASGDLTTAANIDRLSASQVAVDNRIDKQVKPLVAAAIADDDSVRLAAIDALKDSAVIAGLTWARTLPNNTNLDDLKTTAQSGLWHVNSQSTAQTITGKPAGLPNNLQFELEVLFGATGTQILYPYGYNTSQPFAYVRKTVSAGAGAQWSDWVEWTPDLSQLKESTFNKGSVTAGADLNEWVGAKRAGLWQIRSIAAAEGTTNLPPDLQVQGDLLVISGGTTTTQIFYPYAYYGVPPQIRGIKNVSTREWSQWGPLGGTVSQAPRVEPAHTIRQNLMRNHYGPVSTGGKAAIALRCDHGLKAFRDVVLPLCEARGIIPAMAYNPRNWAYAENTGVTATDLNSWVATGRVEIMNHSANHLGAETETALHDQIVGGLREIEAELPAAKGKVFGFAPPGVSTGDYGGFDEGRTPEGWASYAGQLIAEHHAIGYGYLPETTISPLDGHIRDGRRHVSVEKTALADVKTRVDDAIAATGSLQLMVHPNELGKTGMMSVADFTALLDYVASKSSQIMWLSPYQMAIATL